MSKSRWKNDTLVATLDRFPFENKSLFGLVESVLRTFMGLRSRLLTSGLYYFSHPRIRRRATVDGSGPCGSTRFEIHDESMLDIGTAEEILRPSVAVLTCPPDGV